MRVLSLKLENVGPFDAAELSFVPEVETGRAPITLITGENGAGKSIILDAIRGLFGPEYGYLERAIWRPGTPFRAEMTARWEAEVQTIGASRGRADPSPSGNGTRYSLLPTGVLRQIAAEIQQGERKPSWIVDFWRSALATDSYEIRMFQPPTVQGVPILSLMGESRNASTTNAICYFDYLRQSTDSDEARQGTFFYDTIAEILSRSLLDGRFERVERSSFTPLVCQSGKVVPLSHISSGNAYLSQRLMSVLLKMYAVHKLGGVALEETCNLPGLLLIDEAENHLHPRWQKRFLGTIHDIFPNLQIIATTHSPFILASAPDARVYVCRYDAEGGRCVVSEETDSYANKPVDEILVSSAFDHTQPYSEEISQLIEARKKAMDENDPAERRRIEDLLEDKNPQAFSYFRIEERLQKLAGGGAR